VFYFDPVVPVRSGALAVTDVMQHGTFDSCGIKPLLQDKHGAIWFGSIHSNMTMRETHGGLWRYDGAAKPEARFKNFTAKDGLTNHNVWSAVEDKAGNIWMGTTDTGLFRYDGKTFESFSE
jgi:ligand-binding sensor domain-containing protein